MKKLLKSFLLLSLEYATLCKMACETLEEGARTAPAMCFPSPSFASIKVPVVQEII